MYTVIDFETTGLDFRKEQVIQVGAVKLDKNFKECGRLLLPVRLGYGMDLPSKITELTGITAEDLEDGVSEKAAQDIIASFIAGDIIVAHFASFDLGFLRHRASYSFICTKSVFNLLHPNKPASLTNVVDLYNISHLKHHTALDDAVMTADVLRCLVEDIRLRKGESISDYINIMTKQKDRDLKYIPFKADVVDI